MSEVPLYTADLKARRTRIPEAISTGVTGEKGHYRGYSKLRTRTAVGSYSRASPRSIGLP